jgi:hypothetical protein
MREPNMSRKWVRPWHPLKWAGLAASLTLFILLLAQPIQVNTKNAALWVFNGCVIVFHQPVGPGIEADMWQNRMISFANDVGFTPQYRSVTLQTGKLISMSVPLAPLLPLVVIATAVLWRLDRRFPLGRCVKCGYNLTGNVSGVCPEYGTKQRNGRA